MKRMMCALLCLMVLLCSAGCDRLSDRLTQERSMEEPTGGETKNNAAPPAVEEQVDVQIDSISTAPLMEAEMYTAPVPGGMPLAKYEVMPPQNDDEYPVLPESGFSVAKTSPLSTFAADVDTASYANVRRMIRSGQRVDPNAVRVEEMVNAFSYGYAAPDDGAPVAIHTQVSSCPWNGKNLLMRVGLKAQEIDTRNLPASNLVFLIDVSGSMDDPDKLPLVQRSFALLVEQLSERDRVSIVVYAGADAVVLSGARGDEKARILEAIYELQAGGGTNGAAGIRTAYDIAWRYADREANSRVILATDGDFNIGASSENELIQLIEKERERGVFLTVLGFGYGNHKDNNLQALADHGNGNATYIDSIHQARCALVEELGATLHTVAKDVKLQVEFNPAVVEAYRLIGYENRRMAAEDFADDTKDGGEMGAGHCVTALYELVPAGSGAMAEIPLKYQEAKPAGSDEYATVHVRYKKPQGDTSTEITSAVGKQRYTDTPDADFRLAAAITAFGQMISGSKYAGSADERMVLDLLQPLLGGDSGGRIVELSDLVRKSAGLYDAPMPTCLVE